MTISMRELQRTQTEARARAASAAYEKLDLLRQLNTVGEQYAQAEAYEAKAKAQERLAKEEEQRQARLRASQQAYLEQQARMGLDVSDLEQYDWYDGIMPHQLSGIEFGAAAGRWVLGDEPGLGKTRQAIGWMDVVGARKAIVVAPGEIPAQFANEIREVAEHRQVIELHSVTPKIRKLRQERMLASDDAIVVLNYEAFRSTSSGLMSDLLAWRADTLIADEAHVMKNTSTANFRNVERLVGLDLFCGRCRAEVPGLVTRKLSPSGKPVGPPVKIPCPECGWKKGEPTGFEFESKLDELVHTRSVKHALMMTGTPLLNAPDELFSLFHLVRPDLFPTLAAFRKTFTHANSAGHRFFTKTGLANLRELIKPVYLARKKADVGITLPERDMIDVMVPIEQDEYPQQRTVIDQIAHYSQILLDSGERLTIMDQLAQLTRQRQANVFPGGIEVTERDDEGNEVVVFTTANDIDEAAKMDAIMRRIDAHPVERQVVFSKFTSALIEMEARLIAAGVKVVRLDGGTPRALREQIKTNFYRARNERARWQVVLVNYQTGGAGLNLTACTVTHIMDSEWNPGNEEQSLGRTFRIGQTDETTVYRYLVPRSVDTRIEGIKRRKQRLVEAFERGEIATLQIDKGAEIRAAFGGEQND